mmetsp:Transcript_2991/g.9244  ORF Transcript_2991/g.9244 Transcript_2991/m.9244 type:complete len:211 (+) Transcript_2991:758-1390(+)
MRFMPSMALSAESLPNAYELRENRSKSCFFCCVCVCCVCCCSSDECNASFQALAALPIPPSQTPTFCVFAETAAFDFISRGKTAFSPLRTTAFAGTNLVIHVAAISSSSLYPPTRYRDPTLGSLFAPPTTTSVSPHNVIDLPAISSSNSCKLSHLTKLGSQTISFASNAFTSPFLSIKQYVPTSVWAKHVASTITLSPNTSIGLNHLLFK